MLDEAALDGLKLKYQKVGVYSYNGHQLVFRKPTRDDAREYRRERESQGEKHEATEHLAQRVLVALDGELDVIKARTAYTSIFLEEFPFFASIPEVQALLGWLGGLVEDEEAEHLGKGVQALNVRRKPTPEASPNGSGTAPGPLPS